ncbi:MAG: hypothetical protein PHQ46_11375 [Negativicutes bacterium]|nr:hypothetical protein [Negativicutes bacterium]
MCEISEEIFTLEDERYENEQYLENKKNGIYLSANSEEVKKDVRAVRIKKLYPEILFRFTVGDALGIAGEMIARDMDLMFEIA